MTAKAPSVDNMYFTFGDLGGMSGVEAWLRAAAKHRSMVSRVIASRYSESMYVSDRLLNTAAALEAYDRETHKDDVYFKSRLERCAGHAGDPFTALVGDVEKWSEAVKNERNNLAHHNVGAGAPSTTQLFLARSAYLLFILCILRDASAPDEAFERFQRHGDFRWVSERLREIL